MKRVLPLSLPLVLLAYWVLVKAVLFERLDYTTDLFAFLEMSRSFADRRPLLYNNLTGNARAMHSYYIVPLFYPLTSLLGAYGLFAGLAGLWLLALLAIHSLAATADPWERELYWILTLALVLGPVSFWLWDDPLFGWHAELCFLPLSILFAVLLVQGSRWAWVLAVLLVSTQEYGAVMAWAVQVLFEVRRGIRTGMFRRLLVISAGWLLVFGAGMGVLLLQKGAVEQGRIGGALDNIRLAARNGNLAGLIGPMAGDPGILLLAGGVVYLAGIPVRGAWVAILCALPLFALAVVSGFNYLGTGFSPQALGPLWPPRMVMFWALLIVDCLLAIHYAKVDARAPRAPRRLVAGFTLAAAIIAQVVSLKVAAGYDVFAGLTPFSPGRHFVADLLTHREDAFLRCLGGTLPHTTEVACTGSLSARFHRQDIVWPGLPRNAWKPPELIVCDATDRLPEDWGCRRALSNIISVAGGSNLVSVDGLSAVYATSLKGLVLGCQ